MDRKRGGGDMPARKFAYSWADEVEREEEEEQQQRRQNAQAQQPPREEEEEKKERAKADPFGAARPREVVLAEKGVDWRARDRELDASHRRTREQANRDSRAAPGRMTAPRRRGLTPMGHRESKAPPVSCSDAWGGKRKCTGEVPARQGRPAADQGRRVFGELNIGSGGNSSRRSSKNSCNSAGSEGVKTVADVESGNSSRGTKSGESGGDGDMRKGKERKRRRTRSKKPQKQQTQML